MHRYNVPRVTLPWQPEYLSDRRVASFAELPFNVLGRFFLIIAACWANPDHFGQVSNVMQDVRDGKVAEKFVYRG